MEAWQGFKGTDWQEKLMCVISLIKTLLFMKGTTLSWQDQQKQQQNYGNKLWS